MKNLSAFRRQVPGKSATKGCERGVVLRASDFDAERFRAQVDYSGGPDACWPWTGHRDAAGYGKFQVGNRSRLTHRCAIALALGEVPRGKIVMHTCDNPSCCNPAHLRVGTQGDNMMDKVRKGRHVYGESLIRPACWRHGHPDKRACDICHLEAQRAVIDRAIGGLIEEREQLAKRLRARLTFPVPSTSDELAAIVGRSRALVFAAHFGLYGFIPMRMSDIAKATGGSRQRIDQIVDAVTDKLRQVAAANSTPEVAA